MIEWLNNVNPLGGKDLTADQSVDHMINWLETLEVLQDKVLRPYQSVDQESVYRGSDQNSDLMIRWWKILWYTLVHIHGIVYAAHGHVIDSRWKWIRSA